jgi:hypothetical protein
MKKVVLYLERDDVHAMVLDRTKTGYVMLDYQTDTAKVSELLDKNGGKPIVCADAYASVKNVKTKETFVSRTQVEEYLREKKAAPADDVFWDHCHIKGALNVFSVKKAHLQKLWSSYGELGLDGFEVMLKPAALYDYAVAALGQKTGDFALLNLSASLFNYLIVAGGRIFYMEIPGISMDDVVDEIRRSIEFLQVQEGVKGEVFQRIYAVIENEEIRNRLSEKIRREIVPLPELVQNTERIAGRKGYVPLMFGSLLAAAGGKDVLTLKANVKPQMQRFTEEAQTLWRKHGTVLFIATSLVLVGVDAVVIRNIAAMHAFINVNKKRTGSEIPAYVALVKEKKSLETLVATVRAPVDEHTFLVSAANLISYYAGDIAVVSFDYRRTDKTLIVELESASYDAMSAFLKNVRDEGVFSKVTPLSSDNAKAAGKEVIHFKVELVR